MSGRLLRGLVAAALLPWRLLPSPIAQDHFHAPDHDHPQSAVHRHFNAHDDHARDHEHASLSVDNDDVVWLDDSVLSQSGFKLEVAASLPTLAFVLDVPIADVSAFQQHWQAPAHGPPKRLPLLRGPPHLSS